MTPKKSFKRSEPALAFISEAEEKPEKSSRASKAKKDTEPKPTKKTAPSEASSSRAKPTTKEGKTAPEGYKLAPQYIEKRTRRVQLLIQPSLYEAVKAKASSLGISTNEAIGEALRAYTEA